MHAEHADSDKLNDLSGLVIGCAFMVLNTLGTGFLEKVDENALPYELHASGPLVVQQCGVRVRYKDVVVGEYFVDLLVDAGFAFPCKSPHASGQSSASCRNIPRQHVTHWPGASDFLLRWDSYQPPE